MARVNPNPPPSMEKMKSGKMPISKKEAKVSPLVMKEKRSGKMPTLRRWRGLTQNPAVDGEDEVG
jgi:hypothetical protein